MGKTDRDLRNTDIAKPKGGEVMPDKSKAKHWIPGKTFKELWKSAKTLKRVELAGDVIDYRTKLPNLKFRHYLDIAHRVFINKVSKELRLEQPQNSAPYGLLSAVATVVIAIVKWIVTGSLL